MKTLVMTFILLVTANCFASNCDIRLGESLGVKVVEFTTGNVIHSKMTLKESNYLALMEEYMNLQDEGICTNKQIAKKCLLKFEKKSQLNVTLYRGQDKWQSWNVKSKNEAQGFIVNLQKAGFCS